MSTPPIDDSVAASAGNDSVGKPTVLETIRGLQNRTITGKSLAPIARRDCIEHLSNDGYSIAEIAGILGISERTVARDRKLILESHALEPDPKLVPQFVGKLVKEAETSISQIRRAARDKSAEPGVRVDAAHRCYQIISDVTQRLQQLGYLPTAAQRLEASLKHQIDELPSLDQQRVEIKRLRVLAQSSGKQELLHQLEEIDRFAGHADLNQRVIAVKAQLESGGSDVGT